MTLAPLPLLAAAVLLVLPPTLPPAVAGQPSPGRGADRPSETVPLPAPKTAKAPTTGKPCHVGSFTGVMLPGSTVCMKVGGFVRAQTGSGGSAHP